MIFFFLLFYFREVIFLSKFYRSSLPTGFLTRPEHVTLVPIPGRVTSLWGETVCVSPDSPDTSEVMGTFFVIWSGVLVLGTNCRWCLFLLNCPPWAVSTRYDCGVELGPWTTAGVIQCFCPSSLMSTVSPGLSDGRFLTPFLWSKTPASVLQKRLSVWPSVSQFGFRFSSKEGSVVLILLMISSSAGLKSVDVDGVALYVIRASTGSVCLSIHLAVSTAFPTLMAILFVCS